MKQQTLAEGSSTADLGSRSAEIVYIASDGKYKLKNTKVRAVLKTE
jgi:hypothetical protein